MSMAFNHKHLIDINEYSADDIWTVLNTAERFREVDDRPIKKLPTLRGRTVITFFLEPSTRTRTSFELGAKRLSADVVNIQGSSSSAVKGESVVDTARTLDAMRPDLMVVRSRMAGVPEIMAENMHAHIVNAGDGKHQHPSQALLDLYTLWKHRGKIEGTKVGFVGDISHSRVCGSLVPALKKMGCTVVGVAPGTLMPSRPDVLGFDYTTKRLEEVLPDLDMVYMLRIQMERIENAPFPSLREYNSLFGLTEERESLMKPDALIFHPGPINRGVEVDSHMAYHPKRSMIFHEPHSAILVRMAIMYLLLEGSENGSIA